MFSKMYVHWLQLSSMAPIALLGGKKKKKKVSVEEKEMHLL